MTVLDEAQNIGGIVTAARRRERWQQQMANTSNEERREQLREAIADLEQRFPELEDVPPGGAEAFARDRGHGTRSRSPVHEGRRRQGPSGASTSKKKSSSGFGAESKAAKGRNAVPGLDPGARRSKSRRSSSSGSPTPRVDRTIRQTGIPGAVEGGTSATMLFLGATVGLGLLFAVLTSAEKPGTGAQAVPSVIEGAVRAVGRFLSLGDVFPSSPPPIGTGASGAGTPSPKAAKAEGKELLGDVTRAPEYNSPYYLGPRPRRLKPYHFPPQYVTGGGHR